MSQYIIEAFNAIVESPIPCRRNFVVLWEHRPFYGGPEEGGWWGGDDIPVSYTATHTSVEATELRHRIMELARNLTKESQQEHEATCSSQLQWCEDRNIYDSNSIFGEVDGPIRYYVTVTDELPNARFGDRHYS